MKVNLVWHRMFYSCTRMAKVNVRGLKSKQSEASKLTGGQPIASRGQ